MNPLADILILLVALVAVALSLGLCQIALHLRQRFAIAWRLRYHRGLSFTWRRAWRMAGYYVQH